MSLTELIKFLNKKGFSNTVQILIQFNDHKAEIHEFFDELNKFSYYNAFYRIKDTLIEKGLITIYRNEGKKYIRLSKEGVIVYEKLVEINAIIKKKIN